MASSPGWMTSSRPVVGTLLELVMQFAAAVIVDRVRGSKQLEAILVALCAAGVCGSAHGRHKKGTARHVRGSSLRYGDDPPR